MTAPIETLSEAVACTGISTRTTNIAETRHETAKLGRLWQKFYQEHAGHLAEGEDIYGIYHNYESDDVGAFDVVASWQTASADAAQSDSDKVHYLGDTVEVSIPAGKYMVFSEEGRMPNTVMDAWERAWAYFNDLDCEHTRTYHVDFEKYVDGNLEYGQVDLYIGIE